nr:MAG TPA: hypothetical protein [Caudoviricetes sp.]
MEVISSIYNSGYNIKKFYLGSRELNLAYLGNQVIYDEVIGDNDLNYILYEFYGSDTLPNTVEAPVKSAILKGNTKYRDIDTGDILDTFDETKNLELVSVKLPVLTTIGKNLMSSSLRYDVFLNGNGLESTHYQDIVSKEFIQVESSTSYGITTFYQGEMLKPQNTFICEYDNGKNFIKRFNALSGVFATDINTKYIKFSIGGTGIPGDIEERKKIFIELEKTKIKPTAYEPFKSNILTVNEEVELRGVGDVKDELNLLTGEITQRIVEVVLDGSEDWFAEDDRFTLEGVENFLPNRWSLLLSDKYPSYSSLHSITQYPSYIMGNGWAQGFHIRDVALFPNPKNQLSEFKEYLSQNPVTVQYQSATESIKTVDLTIVDQDGKTINKLNSFNGTTHVSTEVAENSAYPMVSLEVASELQAAMSKVTEDIELIKPVQNDIETTIDTQSNDIDSLLLATTELFEMFL